MRRLLRISFLVGLLAAPLTAQPRVDRHVILITIDGFPASMWPNPSIPLPNLRKLAAKGAQADALTVSNPTITWPNHTTLVTGVTPRRHGVLFNGYVTRQGPGHPTRNAPWTDKSIMVRVPTVYDAAHAAGLTTAECDWVAVSKAKTIQWSFAELPDPDGTVAREMVEAGKATRDEIVAAHAGKAKRNIVSRDELWLRAAQYIFERHRPNLLLLHLLSTDSIHHRYGPGSLASYSALALADRLVGEMIRTVESSGLLEQTTFIVTTDHGFKKVQTQIFPNVILKHAGYLRTAGVRVIECDAFAGTQGGIAFIYVTDPSKKNDLLPKLKTLFSRTKGVAQVLDGFEAPRFGMPTPEENQAMGDLILFADEGCYFAASSIEEYVSSPAFENGGSHGFPASEPELDGIFLAAGAGIRERVHLERVSNLDIAPTIAHLLRISFPETDGKVIAEVVSDQP